MFGDDHAFQLFQVVETICLGFCDFALGVDQRENSNGGSDVQVNELPDAIKTVLVQWSHVKIDLNELARLRWIKKMTTPEIATELGWGRTAVQDSVRTIRKNGLSRLNLTISEKKLVRAAIKAEIPELKIQPKFKLADLNNEFKRKGSNL